MSYVISNPNFIHATKYLKPGDVLPEHFFSLIKLSKIRGKKIQAALEAFLVKGKSRKEIFELYNISPGYFSSKLNQLRQCSRLVLEMLPYYTL